MEKKVLGMIQDARIEYDIENEVTAEGKQISYEVLNVVVYYSNDEDSGNYLSQEVIHKIKEPKIGSLKLLKKLLKKYGHLYNFIEIADLRYI